ncbi:IS3 family transposase [Streptomyces olivoreticuli]|uniref:IS3 family transposase n=1 Tax=Streptomyces olivoreticuli TaxID=68246 RepID=UPI00265AA44E|nr:IS3 family transposase [Streptomyces olivoreticuli]WKK21351.1 IS3 family transposase [Streptomyces olivoreticuli]WKK22261.1 IS3 family transposase [Streptomyces olivoreticuli]WKK23022.1 IS3 family transposase [Streptomyces olivoreticuli]WKK23544.1 IS3 family transposase [Streptomyces olivoreticuli]WKK23988.1 IS3 family transposase [Streptomyces olivoreticuli]
MGTSKYSPEFRADAVALYHASPGGTYASVAKDVGINHETLRTWVKEAEQAARPGAVEATAMEKENRQLRARVKELELEREILRRAAKYFGGRDQLVSSRFQFVDDHRGAFGVKRLCRMLQVSRSGFYRWLAGADARAARARADAGLAERITRIHEESDGTYGVPRVTAELKDAGVRVNHKRVERVMRKWGIVGLHLRKKVRTTVSEPSATPVPDLLRRDFTAQAPNTKYVGDITYLPVGGGQFLYLATVLDLCSKRLAGWSIADHMRTELVTDALRAAAAARGAGGLRGAVFHSDNGAQYVSKEFAQVCSELGVTRSRGAVGTSADNAAAESLNATMKRETLQGRKRWNGAREARLAVFRWATRYNTRRRHSRLGQTSPITYEQRSTTLAPAA